MPAADTVIQDPMPCPVKREDLGLIAQRYKACNEENTTRLVLGKDNYRAVVREFATPVKKP